MDTIICYPNLGENAPDTNSVIRGHAFNLSSVTFSHPVETNWEIAKWTTNSDGTGDSYDTNATLLTTGNLTPYAQWHTWCTGSPSANELGENRVDTLMDVQNNKYTVVQIGDQCWMKQNLKVTAAYGHTWTKDGGAVLYDWAAMMNGENSSSANPSDVQGICPTGWHVPSKAEWDQMLDTVKKVSSCQCGGNADNIAKAIASTSNQWQPWSTACAIGEKLYTNNVSGFSALPHGYQTTSSGYQGKGYYAYFWTSELYGSYARGYELWKGSSNVKNNTSYSKDYGLSVRCLRD